ncbi:hypothetical protein ACPCUV_01345 [Streptomyces platensis]|uniref:hypothetical protein n=1 Tax=Streptomyces platensis TaxID=58346 RepID=UPI003C2ABA35
MKKQSSSVREVAVGTSVALVMSLLGGWAAYGYSGSYAVAAAATGMGLFIGLVIYLIIARSGR